jgi:5-amino-6-(5-phosphoribosylamino)uracil reductase
MRVFTNSAMSADGKLGTSAREHVDIGSERDRVQMSRLRAEADAVLVGGKTFRNWPFPLIEDAGVVRRARPQPMLNVVLTRTGGGPRSGPFFQDVRTKVVILAGEAADLSGFPDQVDVHRAVGEPTAEWAMALLEREYGVESLLIEAGGDLIFQCVETGRVDEIFVTVCPWLIGGAGAPSIADGVGFTAATMRALKLLHHRVEGDEIFLHYAVVGPRV